MKQVMQHVAVAMCALVLTSAAFAKQKQPNIVLLFSDDAGYADFGFQGSDVMKTPELDKLADKGIVFSQGYVSDPTCGPSRAGLITGKYQQRFGYEENNVPGYMSDVSAQNWGEMGLPLEEKTMGDYMKSLGYATAFYGKWHLGSADRFHPTKRGFDEFVGFRGGDRSYFVYEDDARERKNPTFFDKGMERGFGGFFEHEGYLTDFLAAEANDFIERNQDKPFFIFLSYNAVHTPMDATEDDLAEYPELEGTRQTVAAMTTSLDRASGAVMAKLKKLGLEKNTIVVFTNDNGGPTDKNASSNFPLSGSKSNHLEGGIRVPFVMKWPKKLKKGGSYELPVSTLDLAPTFYAAGGGDTEDLADLDGVNLLPYLRGKNDGRPHQKMFWKKESRAVIRDGDWKLMRFPDRPAELYNLVDDEAEQNNLAAVEPERVQQMFKDLFAWELTLERPRWMLKREYEKYDLDRMDKYRKPMK